MYLYKMRLVWKTRNISNFNISPHKNSRSYVLFSSSTQPHLLLASTEITTTYYLSIAGENGWVCSSATTRPKNQQTPNSTNFYNGSTNPLIRVHNTGAGRPLPATRRRKWNPFFHSTARTRSQRQGCSELSALHSIIYKTRQKPYKYYVLLIRKPIPIPTGSWKNKVLQNPFIILIRDTTVPCILRNHTPVDNL